MARSDSVCNRPMHTAAAQLDEEEDVEALQPDRLDREEIDGQQTLPVCADELAPRRFPAVDGEFAIHSRRRVPISRSTKGCKSGTHLKVPPVRYVSSTSRIDGSKCVALSVLLRENVDVVPEEILWVVLRLDRSEPRQVRSVSDRGGIEGIVFQVVDVTGRRKIRRE
jgi:hypothetical protein